MEQQDHTEEEIHEKRTSLPPRSEVHKDIKKKTKFRIKYPIIRLLALFFVLLPIAILSFFYMNDDKTVKSSIPKDNSPFESFDYEKNNDLLQYDEDTKNEEKVVPVDGVKKDEDIEKSSVENINKQLDEDLLDQNQMKPKVDVSKSTPPESKKEKRKVEYEIKYHKVKANETLFRVSKKYYNSRDGEELLKQWNDINGDTIYEGQVLRIPIKISSGN
ncbi:LysM peptidoglycan-binding domain-containing protein [Ferdinandcohnia quinoae]|uniref:LysM peptidoglycan-binding domain-containing protein n=1 Tax=Fredinandcohnia quinoae TaxID=2918902 RepID=A0AAW5DVW4_9BACI|nr:LysM domain-containing protein [Fredinandcohnia sp. SECRCQ15]MCH1624782.1 LysM peptidoglycan-binding domain-containing protein [Fredinandcohnia sp. SECRCQ15]